MIPQFQIENFAMDPAPAEDNVSDETDEDKDATNNPSKVEECTSSTPGSGVWEKSENRRWVVVMDTNHRIPSRNRSRSEGSLDPSLSIHSFVSRFEVEKQQPGNYNVISDGSSLVRIDRVEDMEEDPAAGQEEEDPMEVTERIHRIKKVGRARALMSDYFQVKSLVSFLERAGYHIEHNCTIFLCSLDVRNIVQGGDPLYAVFFSTQGSGGYT